MQSASLSVCLSEMNHMFATDPVMYVLKQWEMNNHMQSCEQQLSNLYKVHLFNILSMRPLIDRKNYILSYKLGDVQNISKTM